MNTIEEEYKELVELMNAIATASKLMGKDVDQIIQKDDEEESNHISFGEQHVIMYIELEKRRSLVYLAEVTLYKELDHEETSDLTLYSHEEKVNHLKKYLENL